MRETFSPIRIGSSTRLLAFFQRHHAQPPAASPRAVPTPRQRRLPYLPVLHPQVALEGGQRADAEHGHRHPVHLQRLGLEGVGGLTRLHARPLVGLVHVALRPVGAEGSQHQPGHHSLSLVEAGERPHKGDEGIGAGVEQVVVPEGAQGNVLGAVGPQDHAPCLLPLSEAQRIVVIVHLSYAGLGVVGRELASHHLVVEAAGHQGHAVHVPGQLQGEGFGDGDGLEQVLDAQKGALPRPGRRDRQQDGAFLRFSIGSKQDVLRVQLQCSTPSYTRYCLLATVYLCWPGLHSTTAVSSGVASMRTGKRLPRASRRPSPLGHDSSQRCSSTGRSKASPTVLIAAASC